MTASQPLRVATELDRSDWNPLDHPLCLRTPGLLAHSTWLSHIPLGMLLVDLLRPSVVVELGTYRGVSYCALCQAVEALGLDTRCYAVDTWQGDAHSGLYGGEVLADLREYHDPLYGDFSTLLQSSFDDAVTHFEDSSIDLLHIDGLHTYEAVRHDFETWLPKMSGRGAVMFHDITEHKDDFGVWQLWDEVKLRYPSFEVSHGHGLGILAVGELAEAALRPLTQASPEQRRRIQSFLGSVGRQWELEQALGAAELKVAQQSEAFEWYKHELADYALIRDKLPVRAIRAWSRYGLRGALVKLGRRVLGAGEGGL